MKTLIFIFSSLMILSTAQAEVILNITEEDPAKDAIPVSQLVLEQPQQDAFSFKEEKYQTPQGTIILNGGYHGEGGSNYTISGVFQCKNGRKVPIKELSFCDFKNPDKAMSSDNFAVSEANKNVKLDVNVLADKSMDDSGNTICTTPKTHTININCAGPTWARPWSNGTSRRNGPK